VTAVQVFALATRKESYVSATRRLQCLALKIVTFL
jgi:hypothetical protein